MYVFTYADYFKKIKLLSGSYADARGGRVAHACARTDFIYLFILPVDLAEALSPTSNRTNKPGRAKLSNNRATYTHA